MTDILGRNALGILRRFAHDIATAPHRFDVFLAACCGGEAAVLEKVDEVLGHARDDAIRMPSEEQGGRE
jgi:hypothetical protein